MPYVELLYLRRSAFWSLRGYVADIAGLGVVLLIKLCFYTVKRTTDSHFVILFCDFQRLIARCQPTATFVIVPLRLSGSQGLSLSSYIHI